MKGSHGRAGAPGWELRARDKPPLHVPGSLPHWVHFHLPLIRGGGGALRKTRHSPPFPTPSYDVFTMDFKLSPNAVSGLVTSRSAWCHLHPPQPVARGPWPHRSSPPAALPKSCPGACWEGGSEAPGAQNGNLQVNKVPAPHALVWGGSCCSVWLRKGYLGGGAPNPLGGSQASSHQEETSKLGLKTTVRISVGQRALLSFFPALRLWALAGALPPSPTPGLRGPPHTQRGTPWGHS